MVWVVFDVPIWSFDRLINQQEYIDAAIEEEDEEEAVGRLEMTASNRTFSIGISARDEH